MSEPEFLAAPAEMPGAMAIRTPVGLSLNHPSNGCLAVVLICFFPEDERNSTHEVCNLQDYGQEPLFSRRNSDKLSSALSGKTGKIGLPYFFA